VAALHIFLYRVKFKNKYLLKRNLPTPVGSAERNFPQFFFGGGHYPTPSPAGNIGFTENRFRQKFRSKHLQ